CTYTTLFRSESYGGHSGRETPGPIPNPEAKPASADGTALVRVWECRSPPNTTSEEARIRSGSGLFPRAPHDSGPAPRVARVDAGPVPENAAPCTRAPVMRPTGRGTGTKTGRRPCR